MQTRWLFPGWLGLVALLGEGGMATVYLRSSPVPSPLAQSMASRVHVRVNTQRSLRSSLLFVQPIRS